MSPSQPILLWVVNTPYLLINTIIKPACTSVSSISSLKPRRPCLTSTPFPPASLRTVGQRTFIWTTLLGIPRHYCINRCINHCIWYNKRIKWQVCYMSFLSGKYKLPAGEPAEPLVCINTTNQRDVSIKGDPGNVGQWKHNETYAEGGRERLSQNLKPPTPVSVSSALI